MSGAHFEYQQYRIEDIARSIEELIESNDDESLTEWDTRRGEGYSAETIEKFKTTIDTLRKAAIMAQRVDWLVSGDDGEDSFHRRWAEELSKYER
jgi:nicotinic acid mononucleotide adenylyltransferase